MKKTEYMYYCPMIQFYIEEWKDGSNRHRDVKGARRGGDRNFMRANTDLD